MGAVDSGPRIVDPCNALLAGRRWRSCQGLQACRFVWKLHSAGQQGWQMAGDGRRDHWHWQWQGKNGPAEEWVAATSANVGNAERNTGGCVGLRLPAFRGLLEFVTSSCSHLLGPGVNVPSLSLLDCEARYLLTILAVPVLGTHALLTYWSLLAHLSNVLKTFLCPSPIPLPMPPSSFYVCTNKPREHPRPSS